MRKALAERNGQGGRKKQVLMICRGSLDSVAIVTRSVGQARVLDDAQGVRLHLAWLLDWSYRRDPVRKQWVQGIRREWKFPNFVVYSLPLPRCGRAGQVLSGLFRVMVVAGYIFLHRIGVVLLHCFDGVPGVMMKLRKALGVRCLFDMQGAVPEEVAYQGGSERLVRSLDARERETLEDCDSVFCVSKKLVEHVVRKHRVAEDKFPIVPCCVPRAMVGEHLDKRMQMRRNLGLENRLVMAYSGGTDRYQCVPDMCALFARIAEHDENAFWLVLSWGDHGLFRRCLAEYGVDESRFRLMSVEQSAVHGHLVAADVGLLLREDHVLNRVASPTKFAEYLAAGVPVITTPYVGDVSGAVVRERIGAVVDLPLQGDLDGLMKFLDQLAERRGEFTRRCLDFVDREWTWEGHAKQFRQALDAASGRGLRRRTATTKSLVVQGGRPILK